jgi:hypothetical protein
MPLTRSSISQQSGRPTHNVPPPVPAAVSAAPSAEGDVNSVPAASTSASNELSRLAGSKRSAPDEQSQPVATAGRLLLSGGLFASGAAVPPRAQRSRTRADVENIPPKPRLDFVIPARFALLCIEKRYAEADGIAFCPIQGQDDLVVVFNLVLMSKVYRQHDHTDIHVHLLVDDTGYLPVHLPEANLQMNRGDVQTLFEDDAGRVPAMPGPGAPNKIQLNFIGFPADDSAHDGFDMAAAIEALSDRESIVNPVFFLAPKHDRHVQAYFIDSVSVPLRHYGECLPGTQDAIMEKVVELAPEDLLVVDLDLDLTTVDPEATLYHGKTKLVAETMVFCKRIKAAHANVEFKVRTARVDPDSHARYCIKLLSELRDGLTGEQPIALTNILARCVHFQSTLERASDEGRPLLTNDDLKAFDSELRALAVLPKFEDVLPILQYCSQLLEVTVSPGGTPALQQAFYQEVGAHLAVDAFSHSRFFDEAGKLVERPKHECIKDSQAAAPAMMRIFIDDNEGELDAYSTVNAAATADTPQMLALHTGDPSYLPTAQELECERQIRALLSENNALSVIATFAAGPS